MTDLQALFKDAAARIKDAEALLIGAGAGMGVDSGLPDFRGDQGFWKAYPPFKRLGYSFIDMANPAWFDRDPELAWGFYGHRLHLYQETEPHEGFQILREIGQSMAEGVFVYTSNVDGHFQRAGFDPMGVIECHGSLNHLQAVGVHDGEIWPVGEEKVQVDLETFRAQGDLPRDKDGRLARPNVLMFGDMDWNGERTEAQAQRLKAWLSGLDRDQVVAIEAGAGTAIPSVRSRCLQSAGTLIRLNPREYTVPPGHIGIPCGALEALRGIQRYL